MGIKKGRIAGQSSLSKGPTMAPKPRKRLTAADKRTSEGKFAVVLEKLMAERGVTTQQLADAVGIKEPTVRAWLRAESIPGDVRLIKAIGQHFKLADWRLIIPVDL